MNWFVDTNAPIRATDNLLVARIASVLRAHHFLAAN